MLVDHTGKVIVRFTPEEVLNALRMFVELRRSQGNDAAFQFSIPPSSSTVRFEVVEEKRLQLTWST